MKRKILALLMAAMMVVTCFPLMAFADDGAIGTDFKTVNLDERQDFTFAKDESSKYFKITLPESGYYKVYAYSKYSNDFNDDFWLGLYTSEDIAGDCLECEGVYNVENSDPDYYLFKLDAGTYYIVVDASWNKADRNTAGFKIEKDDGFILDLPQALWAGQYWGVSVWRDNDQKSATVKTVKSSDNTIVKVNREPGTNDDGSPCTWFVLIGKSVGKATIYVTYETPEGETNTKEQVVQVKKYPNAVKSLKVNGKAVNLKKSENKFNYSVKCKKTTTSIKLAVAKGWKIDSVWAWKNKNGNDSRVKVTKKMLTSGSTIKFPKGYEYMDVGFTLKKGNAYFDYNVGFWR